jgi:hypothetical protein
MEQILLHKLPQTSTIEVHNKTHMDIWHTVTGLYKSIKHKNNSETSIKLLFSVTEALC